MTPGVKPEGLIAAALCREVAPWPCQAPSDFETDVLEAAVDHGVAELLSVTTAVRRWPSSVQSAILQRRRQAAAIEIIRERELTDLLATLKGSGVNALLLKGVGLAYTHYPQPWLRPRLDTDLLVAPGERTRAAATLQSLGYEPSTHFAGELVTYQSQFKRVDRHGLAHRVDLHWKIANPQVFADTFTIDELARVAVAIPQLGSNARTLSPAHALVLACLHRVAHHGNSDRLIWLYDIRVLLDAMPQSELEHVAEIAASKGIQRLVAASVSRALEVVGSGAGRPELDLLLDISHERDPNTGEFLRVGRTKFDDLRSDMQALQGWAPRVRLIREHLFPPAAYMRKAYGISHPALLPVAYAIRAVTGASKWFRPAS